MLLIRTQHALVEPQQLHSYHIVTTQCQ